MVLNITANHMQVNSDEAAEHDEHELEANTK